MKPCTYTFQTAEGPKKITGMESMKAFLALNGLASIIEDPSFKRSAFFSMGTGGILSLNRSKSQVPARRLNTALAKYFRSQKWSDAFEAVDVPDSLSAFAKEVKVGFGTDVQYVAPRSEKYNVFLGVQLPSIKNTIFVNATSQINMTTIAGHELYHVIEKTRPDLHEWFKSKAEQYFQNVEEYRDRLNSLVQKGEVKYDDEDSKIEILADFTGDAISDPAFLQKLAEDDPTKFKGLLKAVIDFLGQAITKLTNLGSSKYITEVEALRDDLRKVIKAFNDGKKIDSVSFNSPTFSRKMMPETINVNGKLRPTRNSNGQHIHSSIEGIKNFWEWFGDSKVVDSEGRPLVVYHGTNNEFDEFDRDFAGEGDGHLDWGEGFYFTDKLDAAQGYGDTIMQVYLSLQNPADNAVMLSDDIQNALDDDMGFTSPEEALTDLGHDGIAIKHKNGVEYVAYKPNQIKSATDNEGTFSNRLLSVAFSRTGQMQLHADWNTLNDSGMLTNLQYTFQDKHTDMKEVIKAIKATGRQITDRFNPYLQEELYHGRVAKRVQDFTKQELEPLLQAMNDSGVSMADFEHYLWARHAEERNAQIAKINPDMPDGGSGLTNQEAADYLAQIPAKQKTTYEKLAEQIDAINSRSRNLLVEYGIEDMDTAAKMEEAYKYYVPLMRDEMEKGHGSGTGQGFSIKGNSTKRAMGSNKAVVDIIANIAAQREKFIVRGEKNRVATALVGLAKTNPNDEFWKVDKPPVLRYISNATGFVVEMTDPNYKNRNNVVVARILDRTGRVQERAVVFNEYNERALRMAESLKNLDVDGMEEWIGTIAKGTRYFASVNTQYNPLFGVVNITRDLQAGALNLESTKLAGMQKDIIGQTYNAWLGIYKDLRNSRKGKKTAGNWSALWEEYQKEGGQTGYRELFRTAKDRTDELNKIVDPDWWKKKGWGKVVSLNSELVAKAEAMAADKVGKPIFQWLDDYNASLENSVRLSAYKAGRDKGLSKQEAASIAKNLTVNFNRKGASGARMGAFFAFFNASVQGTARIGETMIKDGKLSVAGKSILTGGILLGVMQALALAGFDDEEPPQFERDRNMIIPVGGNKYVKIPMPLGFHVIPATARILTEYALSGGEDTAKMISHLGEVYADAFNPVGGSASLAQILSPTLFDPVVDLTINEDFAGRKIAQQDFNSLDPTPGFTRARDTASRVSTVIAHVLNNMTGGTDYQPGIISPTPDQIDYLTGQVFGGVGREILKVDTTARSIADGTDLPTYKIPLVGKFYGDAASKSSEGRKFYANIERMNGHENEIKGRGADGKPVEEYLNDNPDAKLWRQSKLIFSTVRKMQKRRESLLAAGASASDIQEIDTRITQRMKALNDLVDSAKK